MPTQIVEIKLSSWLPIKNLFAWYVIAWIFVVFITGVVAGYALANGGSL